VRERYHANPEAMYQGQSVNTLQTVVSWTDARASSIVM
jgi:hypothetical protein